MTHDARELVDNHFTWLNVKFNFSIQGVDVYLKKISSEAHSYRSTPERWSERGHARI